jgi:hypothetical protein
LFDLALERSAVKAARVPGLRQVRSISFSTGKMGEKVIYELPKAARGDRSKFARVTYGDARFCPFCGMAVVS